MSGKSQRHRVFRVWESTCYGSSIGTPSRFLLRSDYPGEAANVEDWGAAYVEKEEIHSYCEGILRYKGNCYYDWILNCQKKLLTSFYFYVARFIDLIKIF